MDYMTPQLTKGKAMDLPRNNYFEDEIAQPRSYARRAVISNTNKYGLLNNASATKPTVQFDMKSHDVYFNSMK